MALELDGLKHSMGNFMQQMQQVMETLKEYLNHKQVEQYKRILALLLELLLLPKSDKSTMNQAMKFLILMN